MNKPNVSITVAIPESEILTSNQRLNKYTAWRQISAIRENSFLAWRLAGSPRMKYARCVAYLSYPNNRKRDVSNLMPTIKAAIDGFVSGPGALKGRGGYLLPDDDDAHLIGPDLRHTDGDITPGFLTITFDFFELQEDRDAAAAEYTADEIAAAERAYRAAGGSDDFGRLGTDDQGYWLLIARAALGGES